MAAERRAPKGVKYAGEIQYWDLDPMVQEDVDVCLAQKARVHPGQVMDYFKRHPSTPVPFVIVRTERLVGPSGRPVDEPKMREYEAVWRKDPQAFPPVVINSEQRGGMLCEGGHRTVAALNVGIAEIPALDIAPLFHRLRRKLAAMKPKTVAYRRRDEEAEEPWWAARFTGKLKIQRPGKRRRR